MSDRSIERPSVLVAVVVGAAATVTVRRPEQGLRG